VAEGSESNNVKCEPLCLGGNICQETLIAAAATAAATAATVTAATIAAASTAATTAAAAIAAAATAAAAWQVIKVLLPDCCQAAGSVGE
jgi:hypothetical protein